MIDVELISNPQMYRSIAETYISNPQNLWTKYLNNHEIAMIDLEGIIRKL